MRGGRRAPRPAGRRPSLRRLGAAFALIAGAFAPAAAHPQSPPYEFDLVIRRGLIIDGTGADGREADVGVREGRIAAIGDLAGARAARSFDAAGRVVAPGFIDLHSHADWGFGDPERNLARNNLTQGISTVVVGQDGRSPWPVGGSIESLIENWLDHGLAGNVLLLVGHGSVRREVMADAARPPTPAELDRMRALVRRAMEAGAYGISTGLAYAPGRFATTEELIALTREVAPERGVYISHLRDQGAGLMESVRETIRIGRESGVTVVATHFKASGRANFGKSVQALDLIEAARRQGVAIYTDQYPYTTSSNGIGASFLPASPRRPSDEAAARIQAASPEALADLILGTHELAPRLYTRDWLLTRPRKELERRAAAALWFSDEGVRATHAQTRALLDDPGKRAELHAQVADEIERWGGPDTYVIERAPDPRLEGRTLEEAADLLGRPVPEVALALELMEAQVTQFHMADADVDAIITREFNATSTDGSVPDFGVGVTHPRSYGAFPRKIRVYALERGLISLPFAIRSMTGLAAEILGLEDRGVLRPGAWADVVVFDPRRIRDRATYRDPHRYSEGIELLLVNGLPVLEDGRVTGARPGVVITPRGVRRAGPPAAIGPAR